MIALFAEAPALPLHTAGPYVAAAYIVFLLIVLIYVGLMARKLMRNTRELRDLRFEADQLAADRERAQYRAASHPSCTQSRAAGHRRG